MSCIRELLRDSRGVSAIEYALLASLIALGLVTSVGQLGTNVSAAFDDAEESLDESSGGKGKKDKDGKGKGKR